MTTNYDVARDLVAKLGGDPHNTAIVKAVAVWLRFESGGNVTGNNPWNITGHGDCGTHTFKGNHLTFATYCSIGSGTSATADLLKRKSAYGGIVKAIRAGDSLGFFAALVKSPWDGGHYAGSIGNMIAAWKSTFSQSTTLSFSPGNGQNVTQGTLAAFVTPGDFAQELAKVLGVGLNDKLTAAQVKVAAEWLAANHPESYDVASATQQLTGKSLAEWASATTGPNVPDFLGNAAKFVGFFLDTQNLLYIMAIVVGIPLALFGFYLLAGVSTGPKEAI